MREPRTLLEICNIRLVVTDMGILFEQNVKDIFGGNAYRYYHYDNLGISELYQFTSRVARRLDFYIEHNRCIQDQLGEVKKELAITKRKLTIAKKAKMQLPELSKKPAPDTNQNQMGVI